MNDQCIQQFKQPGSMYRGAPFWAWNGKLTPEELRRQIRIMHQMGLGGFFMHSRVGLDTPYLSEEWFHCVKACIDEAEKLNMRAWLYDEDRWPSGAAGGLVTQHPEYRHRNLACRIETSPENFQWQEQTLTVASGIMDGNQLKQPRYFSKEEAIILKKGESLLHFVIQLDEPSSWFNDYTYLDTMNHEAVQAFIKETHERYAKEVGEHFGKRVPGIFTDEPRHCDVVFEKGEHQWQTPWTGALPETFQTRYGYSLLDRVHHLFFEVDGEPVQQTRYHYMDCTTFLFVDAYARQIGEWCEENQMLHTGHVMEEDTLSRQSNMVGSPMRFYEYMQAPGIDLLMEHWRIYDTAKQVASVAHQFNRTWRLTETYGCTGWDFSFAGHKALGDWQVALGINLRCQHLSWYTMEGEAKRDYPASIFYQSPWWEEYRKVEDYFGRILAMMTQGTEVRDLLVIHPVESIWLHIGIGWKESETVQTMDKQFIRLRDQLLTHHLDFDYGDEEMMARHAHIKQTESGPVLQVNKAYYRAVIVPEQHTMRQTTLELLESFKNAGGTVIFAGQIASHVDAMPSNAVQTFAKTCVTTSIHQDDLIKAVEQDVRRVSIKDEQGKEIPSCLYLLREDEEHYYLFVCNTGLPDEIFQRGTVEDIKVRDRTLSYSKATIELSLDTVGNAIECDPETGEFYEVPVQKTDISMSIATSFPKLGSRLFVFYKGNKKEIKKGNKDNEDAHEKSIKGGTKKDTRDGIKENKDCVTPRFPQKPDLKEVKKVPIQPNSWEYRLSESNVLVLDKPEYSFDGQQFSQDRDVLQVDHRIREKMGLRRRGGAMVQPWARPPKATREYQPVQLRYTFIIEEIPSGSLLLALEQPESFVIHLNGYPLSTDKINGWWCDRTLRTIPLNPSQLKIGTNTLNLACEYHEDHPGLEIMYLLGNFGVQLSGNQPVLGKLPVHLAIGDWGSQGLPFYAGNVSYITPLEIKPEKNRRYFIRIPAFRGTAVNIYVGNSKLGCIAWEPQELEITNYINEATLDVRIELLGHRRNSHGPFHLTEAWPQWTGPAQFQYSTEDKWTDGYTLVPCGLIEDPELIIKELL